MISMGNALDCVFLHHVILFRSIICGLRPPPYYFLLQCNEINMTMPWFFFNSIIGQCTEHITSHYILYRDILIVSYCDCQIHDTQPLPPLPILTLIIEVKLDAVQSLNVVPSIMSLILCYSNVCLVLIISRWCGWTNLQFLKCNIFFSV